MYKSSKYFGDNLKFLFDIKPNRVRKPSKYFGDNLNFIFDDEYPEV